MTQRIGISPWPRSRSAAKPICPEGERYCGIPVWRDHRFDTLAELRVM